MNTDLDGYPCPHANILGQFVPNSLTTGKKAEKRPWFKCWGNPKNQAEVHKRKRAVDSLDHNSCMRVVCLALAVNAQQ